MFIKTGIFTKENLLNFLVLLVPLSLIIGNSAVNLNVVLICLMGLGTYGLSIFKIKKDVVTFLLCLFFLYLILITLINNIPNYPEIVTPTGNLNNSIFYKEHIIKSFLFLRFLILFLIVNKMAKNEKLNFKLFFISTGVLSFLVASDVFVSAILDKKFIDQSLLLYFTGFFGDENIAGGYIQKFSLFFIFSLFLFFSISDKKKIFFIFISFLFFFAAIIITNNRMPVILYLTSFSFLILIEKKIRLYLILFLFLSLILLTSIIKIFPDSTNTSRLMSFYGNAKHIIRVAPELFYSGKFNENKILKNLDPTLNRFGSGHLVTFNSGVQVWKKHKIFGGGLKSFRLNCQMDYKFQVCNTHPHNYFIEILVDTGLVGLILIYGAFTFLIINFFRNYLNNNFMKSRFLILPFFLIFFFEIFPLRSTGSFFSTSQGALLFIILPIINNYYKNSFFIKKLHK